MKLIVSDRPLTLAEPVCRDIRLIDLSGLQITNCVGCFGCWTKTPGKCVIRDDAVKVYPCIAASDKLMYVSKIRYGESSDDERAVFEKLVARNAHNMNFESWRVVFAPEHELEQTVEREVLAWEKS